MSEQLTYTTFESRYRDKQYIGAGGFGKVYKVFDHAKNHYVALKVADVRPEWKKFTLKNEVELVNKMSFHRNIARYDACYRFNTGITGDMDFAILKFYEYGNLEQFLTKENVSVEDKRLIIQGILDGTSFLHKNNVIHRDLKAQNILLSREDGVWTPKITDFGLSREITGSSTITNSAVGISYAYAAPEQILNRKIFKNVDLWALGVIIYRVMEGELPFLGREGRDGKSSQSQLELSKKIVNLDLPEKLELMEEPYRSMIKRCLVLDPLERAQTADELLDILKGNFPDLESKIPSPTESNSGGNQYDLPGDIELENEKTQVLDSAKDTPSPVKESAPVMKSPTDYFHPDQYAEPRKNVTQIVNFPKNAETEVKDKPLVKEFRPNSGGNERKFNALWVIIPLLLIAVSYGGYWWMNQEEVAVVADESVSNTIEFVDRNEGNQTAFVAVDYNDLKDDIEIAAENNSSSALVLIQEQLKDIAQDYRYPEDYRTHYYLAQIEVYLGGKQRTIMNHLSMSSEIAIRDGLSEELLNELIQDENMAFAGLQEGTFSKKYNKIKEDL